MSANIRVLGVRVGAIVGAERISILCADVDVSLLGPSDAGAVSVMAASPGTDLPRLSAASQERSGWLTAVKLLCSAGTRALLEEPGQDSGDGVGGGSVRAALW